MSLDISKVALQVSKMVTRLKDGYRGRLEHLNCAVDTLREQSRALDSLKKKLAASHTTWLVAGLTDGLDKHYAPPPLPPDFTVIATDGSNIDVDRHRPARCFLLNIGSAVLHYGGRPDADLDSRPTLYAGDDELVLAPKSGGRELPVEGPLLGIKRSIEECRCMEEIAAALPKEHPALGLMDGTLILWGFEAYPDFVSEMMLENGFLRYLDGMKKLAGERTFALASYISFPRSMDVGNVLRIALCPHDTVDTDRCSGCADKRCEKLSGVPDKDIFLGILKPGERSSLFVNQSSVVRKQYREHWVYFFYIRTDDEVARVEVPEWVARDEIRLGLTHALVLDQCRRGQGYPVALSEAHEQAVVTGADREEFWQLVEASLEAESLTTTCSAKSQSKRTRWV